MRGMSRGSDGPPGKERQPISYAGTQLNFFGSGQSGRGGGMGGSGGLGSAAGAAPVEGQLQTYPYGYAYPPNGFTNNVQLGLVTDHMLRKLDESRMLTMTELIRRTAGEEVSQHRALQSGPARRAHDDSTAAVIEDIAVRLTDVAAEDRDFRAQLASLTLGPIQSADIEETSDSVLLSLAFRKPRAPREHHAPPRLEPKRSYAKVEAKVKSRREPEEEAAYEREEDEPQEGTLKPYRRFDPEADAQALRKAMKGLGTDEAAIVDVLGHRVAAQRMEVLKTYKALFGKDLVKDLKGELSGDFWKLVRALLYHPADYDASVLRAAIKGLGTDNDAVIEVICTRNNASLKLIRDAYQRMFSRSLEEDLADDTSGHYGRLLLSLVQGRRSEERRVDAKRAAKEAEELLEAGPRRWGTDESAMNALLVSRSPAQLRATFAEVERLSRQPIDDLIKSETSGDLAAGLLTLVRCVRDKPRYFAKALYKATKGAGTDDDALVRIVVSRAEVDMVQVAEAFRQDYHADLAQAVAEDTSGDYRALLLALLGHA